MSIFSRKINRGDEVERLKKRLGELENLKTTVESPGWVAIAKIFHDEIARYTQQVFDLSDEPLKNAEKIKLAHYMAQSLSGILGTIDRQLRLIPQTENQIEGLNNNARIKSKEVL